MQGNKLFILDSAEKGRGVYAGVNFERGDLIEICPVIELSRDCRSIIHKTELHDYYFEWSPNEEGACIALGYGSLYNHSSKPNAQFVKEAEEKTIVIECIEPIEAGQEITISYNDNKSKEGLWFEEKP